MTSQPSSSNQVDFRLLEKNLGYAFKNRSLLERALTHRSYSNINNERLEFLGDSVLNHTVTKMIFCNFLELREGDMSRIRASLVNQDTLAQIAQNIKLGQFLRLGPGEIKTQGYKRPSILSDALEAIFAAISLDADFSTAELVIKNFFASKIELINPENIKDSKSSLQEKLQFYHYQLPQYSIIEQFGEAHHQTFVIECKIPELNITTQAQAQNRKQAEQKAAYLALKQFNRYLSE